MRSTSILTALTLLTAASGCGDDLPSADADADAGVDPDAGADPDPDAEPAPEPGITFLDYGIAADITPDGRLAVFEDFSTPGATMVVFYDTVTGVAKEMTDVGDPSRALATGISSTRRLTALHGGEILHAGVWTEQDDWLDLGSPHAAGCGGDIAGGFDISADGEVVVGLAWNGCSAAAFRWTDGAFTNLDVLGTPSSGSTNPPNNRASVISDDGTVMAGFAQNGNIDRSAAVWNADGTGFMLDPSNVDAPSEILSISADGKTLAGVRGWDGIIWTEGTGIVVMSRLESSLPSDPMYPNAISADGGLVFGGVGDPWWGVQTAFLWTAQDGMTALTEVAIAAGVTLPEGTMFNNVLGASADGTVLIGTAMDAEFLPRTFVLRLPADAFDDLR